MSFDRTPRERGVTNEATGQNGGDERAERR